MCEPATMMLALGAVSTGLSVIGQQQQADAQAKSLEHSARLQNEALAEQYKQIQQQGTDEVSKVARAAMVEQARMRVAAGESGIAGATVDMTLGNSAFNAAEAIAGIQRNTKDALKQSNREGQAGYASMKSKANQIQQPNYIGAGLQIAGAYLGNKDRIDSDFKKVTS